MLDRKSIEIIRKIIDEQQSTVILSHMNPDGDAIGSSTALAMYLKKQNVPVNVILPNEVPDFLKWIPGFELIYKYTECAKECKNLIANAKAIFILDFNEADRLGGLEDSLKDSNALKIMLDHHEDPSDIADLTISEAWRGSVGEMVYKLIVDLGGRRILDKDIATSLYVAIMTDTGNFRHSSSYQEVFETVGDLMNFGIDKNEIFSKVYDSYSEQRMKLMGYSMSEKMKVLPELHTAYIYLTQAELDRFDHQVGDTEGFVNIPFSIKGIKVSALFIEKKDHVKISLRSKGDFSVDSLASEYYKGGGHVNAAGGQADLPLDKVLLDFERIIAKYEEELSEL